MNPQPLAQAVANRYQDAYGKDYLAYELANEDSFLELQKLALEDGGFGALEKELLPAGAAAGKLPGPAAGKPPASAAAPLVLDLGCATGALLCRLRERGWRVQGVEISPSAAYCRETRGLDVSSLPLEDNHFSGSSFDLVLASHLIEHLNDPSSFVREVYRILKTGGRFFVTTPNIAGFQARIFGSRWRSAIFDHLYLFSVKTLSRLLEQNGFRVERVRTWGGLAAGSAPPWLKKIADRSAKRLGFGDVMLIRCIKND
jgi:SAM-dependent methyltransferase